MIEVRLKIYTDPEKTPLSRQTVKEIETVKWFPTKDTVCYTIIISELKQLVRLLNGHFLSLKDNEIDLSYKSGFCFSQYDTDLIINNSYYHKSCKFRFDSDDFVIEITTKHHFEL